MSPNPPVVIRDTNDLRRLRSNPAVLGRRLLIIDAPRLAGEQWRTATERIAAHAADCGCSMGAKCMAAVSTLAALSLLYTYGWSAGFLWHLPFVFLFALAGAGAGKVIGILRARQQLKRELTSLIEAMEA